MILFWKSKKHDKESSSRLFLIIISDRQIMLVFRFLLSTLSMPFVAVNY